jgi:hypothetical protein
VQIVKYILICSVFFFGFIACGKHTADYEDESSSSSPFVGGVSSSSSIVSNLPATVNFSNVSSFKVDIYKNLNPEHFDEGAHVCAVESGQIKTVTLFASYDDKIGDTFYIRYKILLANAFETGTNDIYIDAERNLSNINLVIENGKNYSETIPQPQPGELKFMNGYIAVQNIGSLPIRIEKGNEILGKLNDGSTQLEPGQHLGYYEMPIPRLGETLTLSQLKAFNNSDIYFPEFTIERGKLYRFTVNNATITGPEITNINPIQ